MNQKLLLFLLSVFASFQITAQCNEVLPDYYENYSVIPADCWEVADAGDATSGPAELGSSQWIADEFLNSGTDDGAYKINLWRDTKSDWLLSPEFDLTGGPFQVEFDFGIMEFGSSNNVGVLGSDDTVQLLITNDGGSTWINLLTYDNNSIVSVTGEHPVVDLSSYSEQTVKFGILASEGSIDDAADNDIFIDNFRVRSLTTCLNPIELVASNLTLNSVEVSWVEVNSATLWNIEYGIAGFAQGTGTVITGVSENTFILTDLLPDTEYEFYVQAICDVDDESSWSGPHPFFIGYCQSAPTSNDGEGVTNVTIGNTDFQSLGDVTYENHTANTVSVFRGIETIVGIGFATGFTYDTNIWIDFNDDLVFDMSELVYQGESASANPTILNATFTIPVDAQLGEYRMRIGTADFGQSTPNPCYSGSYGVTLDFVVSIQDLNCIHPEANYSVSTNCDTNEFYIDVNIISLGDTSSLEISNTYNDETVQATAIDLYQVGPFSMGNAVKVFVVNEEDSNCVISSDFLEVLACPPSNDECESATVVTVNDDSGCEIVASGTILAATASGQPSNSCNGVPDDDVWFSFTAVNEVQVISIVNVAGGTFNLDYTLYEGTCGALTEIYCSETESNFTPNLIVGNTYYIRVFSNGSNTETSTFDLCIRAAQSNFICDNATMFCTSNGALVTSNSVGVDAIGGIACLFSTPNPTWNALHIGESGSIELEISQTDLVGNGLDVDFAVWGPFDSITSACETIEMDTCSNCPSNTSDPTFYPLGNIVDCSYSFASVENATIDNAQVGEIYILLVTNYSGSYGTITIEQTNMNEEDAGGLTGDFEIALGPDINICEDDVEMVTLNATSPFADSYEWFLNGISLGLEPEANSIEIASSGVYSVHAYNENCNSLAVDEIVVSFIDCDNAGIIAVSAFYDDNENTVFDAAETNYTNGYFTYEMNNDGIINTIESSTGSFTIANYDEANTYDINYYFYDEYSDCYDVSTTSFENVNALFGETITVEFPVINQQTCEDIAVYLINGQSPRPGFNHDNYLIIENLGLTTTSGTVSYNLDENLSINNINTNNNFTTTLNPNGFSLDFVNLLPGQSIDVVISLQTSTSVVLGELVTNTVNYTTASNDIVLNNNTSSITEEVIGSYDPNDKIESHGTEIVYDDFVSSDEYLYYTIRFQNLGTADAINVRIVDVLDAQLDETTFQMLRSSHNYVVNRLDNNLEWNFNNINLPAEQDDEEGSHGFVYFKIKPKPGYLVGDIIPNSAAIYFDFNAPIITNTFNTTFMEPLSVDAFKSNDFTMYPNPATDNVVITFNKVTNANLRIYDVQGKTIVIEAVYTSNSIEFNVESLKSGLYFVEVLANNASKIQKLIIN